MVNFAPVPVSKVLEVVSGTLVRGDSNRVAGSSITHLAEPLDAGSDGIAFLISETFLKDIAATKASVVVMNNALSEKAMPVLAPTVEFVIGAKDAYLGLALFSKLLAASDALFDWRLEQSGGAAVHPTAEVHPTARLAPGVAVGAGARIGARVTLLPNVVVGPAAQIGNDSTLFPGVVIYPRCVLGARVRIHANSVIGSDGFGYARGPGGSEKIWHLGKVVVGDDVEIGAGTMIDRGTIKDTIIEPGVKIDNLVQIGHNGHVKAHAILCGQVGLAGNVTVGQGTILAGGAAVADKIVIGNGAIIGPKAGISKDVGDREIIMGVIPGRPRREWWRLVALIDRLPELFEKMKKFEGKQ